MKLTPEQAAKAISDWILHPSTDPEEIASALTKLFGRVYDASYYLGPFIDITLKDGCSEADFREEINVWRDFPEYDSWSHLANTICEENNIFIGDLEEAEKAGILGQFFEEKGISPEDVLDRIEEFLANS